MNDISTPRPYLQWRTDEADREEDAAHVFGYFLMKHCRTEAIEKGLEDSSNPETLRAPVEKAVDTALHNVADLLEGFWRADAGPEHNAEFALEVRVRDENDALVESVRISPGRIDLPIGFWKWRDGEFR